MLLLLLRVSGPAQDEGVVELYEARCMSCHRADGNSPLEDLNFADGRWKHGSRPADIVRVIREGVPETAMQPFKDRLSAKEIEALARYVKALDKTGKKK